MLCHTSKPLCMLLLFLKYYFPFKFLVFFIYLFSSQGFFGVPDAVGGRENKQQVPLFFCSLSRDWAFSLRGVRVGVCQGLGLEGWLRWFAYPLGGVVCRGHVQYPAFALNSRSFSWVFWSLCIFCPEFALTAHACNYFSSHVVPLYFVAVSSSSFFLWVVQGLGPATCGILVLQPGIGPMPPAVEGLCLNH